MSNPDLDKIIKDLVRIVNIQDSNSRNAAMANFINSRIGVISKGYKLDKPVANAHCAKYVGEADPIKFQDVASAPSYRGIRALLQSNVRSSLTSKILSKPSTFFTREETTNDGSVVFESIIYFIGNPAAYKGGK